MLVAAQLERDLTAKRLRSRLSKWGAALTVAVLLPVEVVFDRAVFSWQYARELSIPVLGGLMAMVLVGPVLALAERATRPRTDGSRQSATMQLALVGAVALIAAAIVHAMATTAATWSHATVAPTAPTRYHLALLAMACTSAASRLIASQHAAQKVSPRSHSGLPPWSLEARCLLGLSVLSAVAYYALPFDGVTPARSLWKPLWYALTRPGIAEKFGRLTLALIAGWPAMIVAAGLLMLRRPPKRSPPVLAFVAIASFPFTVLFMLLARAAYFRTPAYLFAGAADALIMTAWLVLESAIAESLARESMWLRSGHDESRPSASAKKATTRWLLTSGAIATAVIATLFVATRPPETGIDWPTDSPTATGDQLFGKALLKWRHHYRKKQRVGAPEHSEGDDKLRKTLVDLGTTVGGPGLGEALRSFTALPARNTSGRLWLDRIGAINLASRKARLPYYVDAKVMLNRSEDGDRYRLSLNTYSILAARRFESDQRRATGLRVNPLGSRVGSHGYLGFSKTYESFALVLDQRTRGSAKRLWDRVEADGVCNQGFDSSETQIMMECGDLVKASAQSESLFETSWLALVERHEIQHQLDGSSLPIAPAVAHKLGNYNKRTVNRTNRELSAHLSELVADIKVPQLGLVDALRHAAGTKRGAYYHASVVLFEVLGGESIRTNNGAVDIDRLGATFGMLVGLPRDAFMTRAQAAYRDVFGRNLPRLTPAK